MLKSTSAVICILVCSVVLSISTKSFSQGSLTPPGPPLPTMKTLDQVEARIPISSIPTTITLSGSYYLTETLTGVSGENGIVVTTGSVTIDLNGFAMIGVAGSKSGIISTTDGSNLTVYNGTVKKWGVFGIDTLSNGSKEHHFEKIRASNNGITGLYCGERSIIKECIAISNGQGGFGMANGGICTDSIAENNGFHGFTLGNYSTISNCSSTGNGWVDGGVGAGFYLNDSTTIRGCSAYINHSHGIIVRSHAMVLNNTCNGNGRDHVAEAPAGIYVVNAGYANKIEGNHVTGYHGIETVTGGNLIIGNSGMSGAFSTISTGNTVGPIINGSTIATNTNPHANIEF